MNYTSFLVKVVGKPKQSFFKDNVFVVKTLVQFVPTRNTSIENVFQMSIWGNSSYDIIKYYQPNDYMIIEGYISLHESLLIKNYSRKNKHIKISVFKVYPFLIV